MDPRRLCHISDLPNSLNFLPIEIKHLLPIHHPSFIDNLTTIIANQARILNWTVYPDLTLSFAHSLGPLGPPHYPVMSGGWCEDIDGQPHHLKSSLELAAIVLNYIYSLLLAPAAEQELAMGQSIIRAEHIGFEPKPMQIRVPVALAYNIYKTKDKEQKGRFIFLVGQHRTNELRLYAILNAVRHWNLHRLRADNCIKVTPVRVHKQLEHLLTILRGFLQLEEVDHQAKKRQLQLLVGWVEEGELPKEVPREGIEADQLVVLSRFEWTYKSKLQQKDVAIFGSYFLGHILAIMPVQTSCSFIGRSCYYPKLNQLVLLWMTAFKRGKSVLVDEDALGHAVRQAAAFLRQKLVQAIKDNSNNIADQMLKSSLRVLSRYSPGQQRTRLKEWNLHSQNNSHIRQKSNSIKDSVIEERPRAPDFDRMSMVSKISFKNPQSEGGRDARTRMQAEFQSLSFPLASHRDRQYAELLGQVEIWQKVYGKITPWEQLRSALQRNCERVRNRYARSGLSGDESRLLLALVAIRYYLQVDQFLTMLKNHIQQREALFEVLFQRSAGGFLMELGVKLAKDSAMSLYQVYIVKECSVERGSLIMHFMKRLVGTFAQSTQIMADLGDRVSVPVLLQLLQSQEIRGEKYQQVARGVLGQIFAQTKALRLLSPLLHAIHKTLVGDHHEQLVMGLLGGLAYEATYFSYDLGQISNSPYRKEQGIRQKKLLQVLRVGGFGGLGYQIKQTLGQVILRNADYMLPSARIYDQIVIGRPLQLARFVQTLLRSPITQHLTEVVQCFQGLQRTANSITRPVANAYLVSQVVEFKWQGQISGSNGFKSESGIFKNLLEYNPQIRIAGRSLSEVLRERETERGMYEERWDTEIVMRKVGFELQEVYEYLVMVGRLKEKYEGYEQLQQDQRIYLREIVHKILGKKSELLEYLQLAALVIQFGQEEGVAIF